MLKGLFKPKWQHKDAQVRRQALSALTAQDQLNVLLDIAKSDLEKDIRIAALNKIESVKPLQSLLNESENPEQWAEIATRIADIEPDNIDALAIQFEKRAANWEEEATKIIKKLSNTSLAESILLNSNNEQNLLDVALSAKAINLRLAAVEKINTSETLQALIKQSSHKQVIQAAKSRLNERRLAEKACAENKRQAAQICEALEALSKGPKQHVSATEYLAKIELNQKRWQALETEYVAEYLTQYQSFLAECQAHVNSLEAAIKQAEREKEARQSQSLVCEQLQHIVDELSTQILENVSPQAEALSLLEKTWRSACGIAEPAPAMKGKHDALIDSINLTLKAWQDFNELSAKFESLIEKADSVESRSDALAEEINSENIEQTNDEALSIFESKNRWLEEWRRLLLELNWPTNKNLPKQIDDWQSIVTAIEKDIKVQLNKQDKAKKKLLHKIGSLQGHIKRKNLIAANKLFNYIQFEKAKLNERDSSFIDQRLESVEAELTELRDWHAFVTEPKKEALCEQMEALEKSELEPLALADAIHKIQDAWHELVSSDSKADEVLWERFKGAADTAYQPCHTYYAEQDKVRSDNLKSKIKICEAIELFIENVDWDKSEADDDFWRKLDKDYSRWTKEWKTFYPVPNNEQGRIQGRFGKSIQLLKAKLKQYKQVNLEAREKLIQKAKSLLEQEDLNQAIDSAKRLQQDWKAIGITFFKADKAAWKSFRSEIDKIFARRNEEKAAFIDTLKANEGLIKQLTDSVVALAKLDDEDLRNSMSEFNDLISQWDPTLTLPRKNSKQLLNAYDAACERFKSQYSGIDGRKRSNQLSLIAQILRALHGQSNNSDEKLTEIADEIDTLEVKANIQEALRKSLEEHSTIDSTQLESNEAILEELALDAEVKLEIETPQQFKQDRMTLQLKALESGLTSNTIEITLDWLDNFILQWASRALVPQKQSNDLISRFEKITQRAAQIVE